VLCCVASCGVEWSLLYASTYSITSDNQINEFTNQIKRIYVRSNVSLASQHASPRLRKLWDKSDPPPFDCALDPAAVSVNIK
jgi:hypothetical protein